MATEGNKEMKYYSLEPALSRGAKLIFAIGHRGSGKTYSFKDWCIKTWEKTGAEWVYIRRGHDEIAAIKNNFWDDIIHKYGYEIKNRGSACYIRPQRPDHLEGKERGQWESENPWKIFGYFIPLSKAQDYKSASFPKVDKICFDEFIIENQNRRYIPDEVNQFMGLISTIARQRPVKTVALSNSGYINNPYFGYYEISSNDFKTSKFIKRNNGNVLFEYYDSTDNIEVLHSSTVAKISNDKFKEYALSNKFKDGGDDLVDVKPNNAGVFMKMTLDGSEWLTLYESKNSYYWVDNVKADLAPAYSLNKWKPVNDTRYSATMIKTLKLMLDNRSVRFKDADTREKFLNWLRN